MNYNRNHCLSCLSFWIRTYTFNLIFRGITFFDVHILYNKIDFQTSIGNEYLKLMINGVIMK